MTGSTITYDVTSRRNQLSRPLRRRRRTGIIVGLILGLVWSTCLMVVLAQLGTSVITFDPGWPWWVGLGAGMVFSAGLTVARSAARRLRIRLVATRAGFLSAAILTVSISVAVVVGSSGNEVSAQEPPQVDCPVAVGGPGVSGPTLFSDTTAGDPLVVDLDRVTQIVVEWRLPPGAEPRGRTWVIGTEIAGFDTTLATATADDDSGRFVIDGLSSDVAPGIYPVWGEFQPDSNGNQICRRQQGYVRIVGSPLTNPLGAIAGAGLVVGLGATVLWARRSRLDLWSITADDVTIEILDPDTGRRVRGPLRRGARYRARITIDFPDPASAYVGVPGPVETVVGVVGGSGALGTAALNPGGTVSAEIGFDVPAAGTEPLQLNTDLAMAGNVIRSIRLVENVVDSGLGGHRIPDAVGQVVYRALDLTARDLLGVRPVDAGLMIHGNRNGERLELWGFQGDSANRTVFRSVIATADLALAADDYRRCLDRSAKGWLRDSSVGTDLFDQKLFVDKPSDDRIDLDQRVGGPVVADSELLALVTAGSSLRTRLLGDAPPLAPFDATVSIAHDIEVTKHMTFPWTGLYRGVAPLSSTPAVVCPGWSKPSRCPAQAADAGSPLSTAHPPDTVCPYDFWGLRYELAWPDGWTPGMGRPSAGRRFRLRRRRDWTANLISNRLPVTMVSLIAEELVGLDHLGPLRPAEGVTEQSATTVDGFLSALDDRADRVEVVYCTAHGGTAVAGGGGDYALDFDRPLTGDDLATLGAGHRFEQGPLVIINACDSGVVSLSEDHALLSAFRRLGARAVIVTEAPVRSDDATAAVAAILAQSLRGNFVGRAVLNARRADYADNGKLTWLAYSYYGPLGLRFTKPLPVDVTTLATFPPPSTPLSAMVAAPKGSAGSR